MADSSEIIFQIDDDVEGGFFARALGHSIFTQADTREELAKNVREAVELHFEGSAQRPRLIRLHFVRDEVIAL